MDKPGDLENKVDAEMETWAHPAGKLKKVHRSMDGYYPCEVFAYVTSFLMTAVFGFFACYYFFMPPYHYPDLLGSSVLTGVIAVIFFGIFLRHRRRALLIKHGSWVVNHIPPDDIEAVTMKPSLWTDEPTLFLDRQGSDATPRTYRVFAGADGFTKYVWFRILQRVEHHKVKLYRDPITKEPVAIEKDGRIAVLMPLKPRKGLARFLSIGQQKS